MKIYMYDYDEIDEEITESVHNVSGITKRVAYLEKSSWIYVFQLSHKFKNIDSINSLYKLSDEQIKKLSKIWK